MIHRGHGPTAEVGKQPVPAPKTRQADGGEQSGGGRNGKREKQRERERRFTALLQGRKDCNLFWQDRLN